MQSSNCLELDCTTEFVPFGLAMYCQEEARSKIDGFASRSMVEFGLVELAMFEALVGKMMKVETVGGGENLCHDSGEHRMKVPHIWIRRTVF